MKQAVEMTSCGKDGKLYNCFPPSPPALKIKKDDFLIPAATTNTGTNRPSS
jgi:hypothetical protein